MSLRACVYKNCESIYIDGKAAGNYTIFAFPKNAERFQKWMELGCVPPNMPLNQLYMCSDHFDARYLSATNKRTLLLGQALPRAYVNQTFTKTEEPQNEASTSTEESYVIDLDTDAANEDHFRINLSSNVEDQLKVESTTTTNVHEDDEDACHPISPIKVVFPSAVQEETLFTGASSSKAKRLCLQETPPEPRGDPVNDLDEAKLIDKDEVSTFIFKGEEYVQMSKQHYLIEKRAMLLRLQRYERVLKIIRTQVGEI